MIEGIETQVSADSYRPIVVDRAILWSLRQEEIFIVDYSSHCRGFPRKYFKNMIPEVSIVKCNKTQKFFLHDEYEYMKVETPEYPFGKIPDKKF